MKSSVIIPVFNAEETISYCLDSIFNQTYQDFEIILINDGSTDSTQKIIDKYKKQYPEKFKVFNQKNSGIAITRNNGIKYSSGKYLFFIDNDDYIDSNYLETFINEIERNTFDIIIGGYRRVTEEGKILFQKQPIDAHWSKYMFITPWGKVYKKESLVKNNIFFLDLNIGEDIGLNIHSNLKLKVGTLPYTGYNWVNKRTSTSNTLHKGIKKNIDFIPLLQKLKDYSKSVKVSEMEAGLLEYFIIKTAIYYVLHSGRKAPYSSLKAEAKNIFNWITKEYPQYKKNINISLFKPKGESLSTRFVVCFYILLQKLHLENAFLWVYSKL